LRVLSSPEAFRRACLRLAAVCGVLGIIGLGDRLFFLALGGLLVVFSGLARLAASDLLDDPVDPADEVVDDPIDDPDPMDAAVRDEARATVRRTFRLPASVGQRVALVGELNGWSPDAHPMRREGGWFTVTVDLEPGRTYRYRYLVDGERWENDWAADGYVANAFGTEDCIART
jgi:hypothetical protein